MFFCVTSVLTGPVLLQSLNYPGYKVGFNMNMNASITPNGRRFYLVSPGLTGDNGTLSLESADRPDFYLRHYNYLLDVESRTGPRNPGIFAQDATFRLQADLWHKGYLTLESFNYPNHYIRHQGYRLKISLQDGSDLFKLDASFRPIEGVTICIPSLTLISCPKLILILS